MFLLTALFLELCAKTKESLNVAQVGGVHNVGDFFKHYLSQGLVVHFLSLNLLRVQFHSVVQNIVGLALSILNEVAHEDTEKDPEAWAVLTLAIGVHVGGVSLAITHRFVVFFVNFLVVFRIVEAFGKFAKLCLGKKLQKKNLYSSKQGRIARTVLTNYYGDMVRRYLHGHELQ